MKFEFHLIINLGKMKKNRHSNVCSINPTEKYENTVENSVQYYTIIHCFPYPDASNIAEISKTKCTNFIKYLNAS